MATLVTTSILAVNSTIKATDALEKEYEKRENSKATAKECWKYFSFKDKMKLCWKYYIPVGIGISGGLASGIAGAINGERRVAMLSTACNLAESSLKEYKDKTKEILGEKKEKKDISDAIAQDHVEKTCDSPLIHTENGDTLCFDMFSGRYFTSDISYINREITRMYEDILNGDAVTLNDLYYVLHLDNVKYGDDFGWDENNQIVLRPSSANHPKTGEPVYVIDFQNDPVHLGWN